MNARVPESAAGSATNAETLLAGCIDRARAEAAEQELPVLQCLQQLTGLEQPVFMAALGAYFGYPLASPEVLHSAEPRFDLIGFTECSQHAVVPIASNDGDDLTLVLGDFFDGAAEAWALRRIQARCLAAPRVALAHPDDLQAYLARQEQTLRAIDGYQGEDGSGGDEEVAAVISLSSISDDESPVVKLVNSTLYDALKLQASDIHLECDATCLHVRCRIDGVLVDITQVPGLHMAEQVISRVKVMAELDIAERRVPQDGRFRVRVGTRDIDFRVSIMPNIFGEDAVLRLLDRQALTEQAKSLRLDHLGLDERSIAVVRRLANRPHGMLLVTGPTGSGKTTTLYAAITEINHGRDKIVTIEDPVEYRLPRVLQIPVNEKKGLTFARGLRSILRHDPDKIMVGEIRDGETAQIAVQAALTGHLVFTTVHANTVFDVLARFLHMGVDAYSFAAALNGVVAQRLLRINCPHCAVDIEPDARELHDAKLTPDAVRRWHFRAGKGCGQCRGTGYKGRKAVAEALVINDSLRQLLVAQAPISGLKEDAARAGLHSLHATALALVAAGETTLAEVGRVAG